MKPSRLAWAIALLPFALAACSRAAQSPAPLTGPHLVEWNATHATLVPVRAVGENGRDVFVFGDTAVMAFTSGAPVNVVNGPAKLHAVTRIAAPDGTGQWLVALDAEGRLFRVRAGGATDLVSDRYELRNEHLRDVASFGERTVGFLLPGELVVADGTKVSHYRGASFDRITGGGGIAVGVDERSLRIIDLATMGSYTAKLASPQAAVTDAGLVFAISGKGLYAARSRSALELQYEGSEPLSAVVASGNRVWLVEGDELVLFEQGGVEKTHGAKLGARARLTAASGGDVWAFNETRLDRFTKRTGAAPSLIEHWQASVQPVFDKVCGSCHGPSGSAGLDLSTEAAWENARSAIRQRVLIEQSMPPSPRSLPSADREALRLWLEKP